MAPQKSPRDQSLAMLPAKVREQALRMAADHGVSDSDPMWFVVALTTHSIAVANESRKAVSSALRHKQNVSTAKTKADEAKRAAESARKNTEKLIVTVSQLSFVVYAAVVLALAAFGIAVLK